MRILMVSTNPDSVEKDTGTTASRNKLISLLSRNNDMIFLNALPHNARASCLGKTTGTSCRTYYFKQWFIFGKWLAMFTDLNIDFLSRIRGIVESENIDLICITEPYGIISTSLICQRTPVVYDAHDIASEHARLGFQRMWIDFRMVRIPIVSKIVKAVFLSYTYFVERLACKRAKHIIAITELDKQRFIKKYHVDESKVTAIPVWMALNASRKASLSEKELAQSHQVNIVFHGIYRHPANYEAFKLIENYIAPEVWKRNKNIQFVLAGTDVPQFEKGNIRSLGYVESLRTILDDSDIALVPVLQGTGVRIKILDYMAAGLPIVTTKKGIEGIDAKDGEHAIILESVDRKFVDAILDLASNEEKRERIGANAKKFIEREYSWERIYPKLEKVLQNSVDRQEK